MRSSTQRARIFLSTPHLSGAEQANVEDALASNWIAPLGPHVEAFEREFAAVVGSQHALALSSGTAAIHLGLIHLGVGPGDEVLVSDLTFSASVNPIVYQGARPVLVDSERTSWNIDPGLVDDTLRRKARAGKLPRAVIPVHLYGQSADLDPILRVCAEFGVPVLEDAAEALGASYHNRAPGAVGNAGAYSLNGNKIITTSGGGMLVSDDEQLIAHARKLATQARDPAPFYQHSEIGFNYRLSNILAAIGRAQLTVLEDRVQARRRNADHYRKAVDGLPGITLQPEAPWGRHTRWLTVITVDPAEAGVDREGIRLALEAENIEARPVWKPMHLQPVFAKCEVIGGSASQEFFDHGLCLPSGSNLTEADLNLVCDVIGRTVAGR